MALACAYFWICCKVLYTFDCRQEKQDVPDEGQKGIEMEADFDGQYEDVPPGDDSADEEQEGDEDRLQEEMGDVGPSADTVDERLWNENDKPEENQQGPEKHEKDSAVQVNSGQTESFVFSKRLHEGWMLTNHKSILY